MTDTTVNAAQARPERVREIRARYAALKKSLLRTYSSRLRSRFAMSPAELLNQYSLLAIKERDEVDAAWQAAEAYVAELGRPLANSLAPLDAYIQGDLAPGEKVVKERVFG